MSKDIRKLKDRAAELMAKRRFDKAAEGYLELCKLEPTDLTLRQRLGDAQRQGGKVREAVVTYQLVADRFAREGLLLKAIAVNKVILELDPTHTATQATLATLYAQRVGPARPAARRAVTPVKSPASVAIELPAEPVGTLELESSRLTPLDQLELSEDEREGTEPESSRAAGDMEFEFELDPGEELEAASELEQPGEAARTGSGLSLEELARATDALATPELSLDVDAEMAQLGLGDSGPLSRPPPELPAEPPAAPLPSIPLFSDLEPAAFVELLQRCTLRRYQPGEIVLRQGEPGRSFFVVSSGTVRVRRLERAGELLELARLQEGAFFGEMALLSEAPRSASVEAEGPVELLEFPAEVLRRLMADHPSARRAVERFTRSRLLSSVMAASPLFRPFDAENRRVLIERFRTREVATGERVLREGEAGDGLYVVMQGQFEVRRSGPDGPGTIVLSALREGDVFGEISLLTRSAATADVVAKGPARVLRLPRQIFDEVILTHPQILELVARLSEERMQTNEALLGGKIAWEAEGLMLL